MPLFENEEKQAAISRSGPWLSSRKSEYRDGYWHVLDVADVVEVLRCLQKDSHAEVTISPAAAARMAWVGLRADDWGTVTESTTEDDLSD